VFEHVLGLWNQARRGSASGVAELRKRGARDELNLRCDGLRGSPTPSRRPGRRRPDCTDQLTRPRCGVSYTDRNPSPQRGNSYCDLASTLPNEDLGNPRATSPARGAYVGVYESGGNYVFFTGTMVGLFE
jgi:hypothetical protein